MSQFLTLYVQLNRNKNPLKSIHHATVQST